MQSFQTNALLPEKQRCPMANATSDATDQIQQQQQPAVKDQTNLQQSASDSNERGRRSDRLNAAPKDAAVSSVSTSGAQNLFADGTPHADRSIQDVRDNKHHSNQPIHRRPKLCKISLANDGQ